MPYPSIASNRLQALEIALNIPAQIAFDEQSASVNRVHNLTELFRRQIFRANIRVNVGLLKNLLCGLWADAIDVRQRSFDPLISRYIHSK